MVKLAISEPGLRSKGESVVEVGEVEYSARGRENESREEAAS